MISETLKSIYDSICVIKDQLEPLVPEDDDEEEEDLDMQEPGDPAASKTEYTTGEAERMSKEKGESGEKKKDMKKVGMMIAFLKKKKK